MSEKLLTLEGAELLYKNAIEGVKSNTSNISDLKATKVDGAFVSEDGKYLHLTSDGVDLIGPLGPFSGGGGGGGGTSDAKLTVTNTTSWGRNTSIPSGAECKIDINWSSIEEGEPTGNGVLVLKTAVETLQTLNIAQGDITLDVSEYLRMGVNTLYVTVSDVYNNSKTIIYTINVTSLYLSSTFDSSLTYTGDIIFSYIAVGEVSKKMFFFLDDNLLGTVDVTSSGRQETFTILKSSWATHGAHKFEAYFTAIIEGAESSSNVLSYELICAIEGDTRPIIATTFAANSTVRKYDTLSIPFYIYNPLSKISDVTLTINGVSEVRQGVPNNAIQYWSNRILTEENRVMTISVGETSRTFNVTVSGSVIPISPASTGLELYLTSAGRSNYDTYKDVWEYEDIRAQFSNFTWTSDGWLVDSDGYTALTVKGDAEVNIPFKVFERDFRSSGKTIEIEFSTSDVNDYTATVISCYSGNRGLNITAQDVTLRSEQSVITTQFKEDEHVRITFVIDSTKTDRIIFCYINGIVSGTIQYPADDDFEQISPVGIRIGSREVTTNVYNIRIYNRELTRFEVLNNWICDKQDAEDMLKAYNHNNIYDAYDQIVIEKLPTDLPYMVMFPQRTDGTHTLPQSKSDKIPCDGYYVDPRDSSKNFTFIQAEAAVQGTSSAGYPRKNYKIKFKKSKGQDRPGFRWYKTETGEDIKEWAMNEDAIGANAFTFKADFASSEGANNVELVRIYNDISKNVYKTPPQLINDKIRVGIDGFPILIFYNDGNAVSFLGKYNFNNDKGTENVYGFEGDDESWEITSNVSNLAIWRDDDLITEENPLKWTEAFENRYPDTGNEADVSKLQVISSWLKTTDRNNIFEERIDPATGDKILVDTGVPVWADPSKTIIDEQGHEVYFGYDLPEPVTWGDKTYTEDNGDYRLAKFVNEVEDYFNLDSAMFYYLFTELFLLVDSRAKNAFPTKFSYEAAKASGVAQEGVTYYKDEALTIEVEDIVVGVTDVSKYFVKSDGKWCWIPYDMDTALGINNEGKLTFGYSLEDTDKIEGSNVYNGQYSVMWCNLRDGFPAELRKMYANLVSYGLTYDNVEKRFEDHQSKWPEAVFNEDAYFKYIKPFLENSEDYLEMCLGSKAEQRKWWLYNRFRYIDSKYYTGEAEKSLIKFRAYSNGDLHIVPYADIYARFRMGGKDNSPADSKRAFKNVVTTLHVEPGEQLTDLDCSIFSADQLKDIGDLSEFTPGTCDFSAATKLQRLKVGRETPNPKLTSLTLGNNVLLKSINAINCTDLPRLDASGCTNLEELYLEGCTSLTAATLPEGGMMTTLHLPANITNLSIRNQTKITDMTLEGFDKITTLVFENVSRTVQDETVNILHAIADGSRIRLWNFDLSFDVISDFYSFMDDVERMRGINGEGGNVDVAQILGTITLNSSEYLDYEYIKYIQDKYQNVNFICKVRKVVKFYNYDGTLLDTQEVFSDSLEEAGTAIYSGINPSREDSDVIHYVWDKWQTSKGVYYGEEGDHRTISNVLTDLDLYAHYNEIPIYTVRFYNYDGGALLETKTTRPDLQDMGNFVTFDGELPTPPAGYELADMIGWGINVYGDANVECSADFRTLGRVTHSMDVYAIMNWEIENDSISVVSQPDKVNYYVGETFDTTGMVIQVNKVTPAGIMSAIVTDYTYDDSPLTSGITEVEITVNEFNVTNIPIGMAQVMRVQKKPNKMFFKTMEMINLDGMILRTYFSNGNTEDITEGYTYSPDVSFEEGRIDVTVSYKSISVILGVTIINSISTILEENSWDVISGVTDQGNADMYWDIGDKKSVQIESSPYWNSGIYYFRILDFNHNQSMESPGVYTTTFGVADWKPSTSSSEIYEEVFVHRRAIDSSSTGMSCNRSWNKGCLGRETAQLFYEALPDSIKVSVKEVTKGQSDQSWPQDFVPPNYSPVYTTECKTQKDTVFIPSLCELTGAARYSEGQTSDETIVCTQFRYYAESAGDISQYLGKYDPQEYTSFYSGHYWTRSFVAARGVNSGRTPYTYYATIRSMKSTSTGDFIGIPDSNENLYGSNSFGMYYCFNV